MIATGNIRIVAAFSIAVFFVALAWKLGASPVTPRNLAAVRTLHAHDVKEDFQETDTDRDGLPDWQEALMGTNPDKADSDGNGITDANEPRVSIRNILAEAAASSSEGLLPEDAIGSRLIGEYIYLKEKNAYTSERGTHLGEGLANYVTFNTKFTPYTADDITENFDSSTESIERHRKALQKALDPFLGIKEPEFLLYAQFVKNGDTTALGELRARAALYQSVAEDVLQIPAPHDIANVHLEIANALSFFALVLENLVNRAHDPIASLALLKTYNESEQYIQTTFGALTAYYRDKLFNNTSVL